MEVPSSIFNVILVNILFTSGFFIIISKKILSRKYFLKISKKINKKDYTKLIFLFILYYNKSKYLSSVLIKGDTKC